LRHNLTQLETYVSNSCHIYDLPPGTDEIVAMTEIIDYLEEGLTLAIGKKSLKIM